MSDPSVQQSPLAERVTAEREAESPSEAGVTLHERPFLGYLNLRGDPGDNAFVAGVRDVAGLELPTEPNTVVENDRFGALWLGPNEWYLVTSAGAEGEALGRLEDALAGRHFAVNDLSSGLTTIRLGGPRARAVLEKGCTLDLHPRVFGAGQCAQTLVAKAGALIVHRGEEPAFDLVVRRSFADYLFAWIEDAAFEFGLAVRQ